MGYKIMILEQPAQLKQKEVPYILVETCKGWDEWTKTHTVDQIDASI